MGNSVWLPHTLPGSVLRGRAVKASPVRSIPGSRSAEVELRLRDAAVEGSGLRR